MNLKSASVFACALTAFLFTGSSARAGFVEFSYNFTPVNPTTGNTVLSTVYSNTTNGTTASKIKLTNEPANPLAVSSDVVAMSYQVESDAPANNPDTFVDAGPGGVSNGAFLLRMNVVDSDSGASLLPPIDFAGRFYGTVSKFSADIDIAWDEDYTVPQTFVLGNNEYSVWFERYSSPPTPNGSTLPGSITFHIDARPLDVQKVPEPTSMALGCIGLSVLGLAGWRKRRQLKAAV